MQKPLDPMSVQRAGTPSASHVLRRRYGPARYVIAAVCWLTVFNLLFRPVDVLAATQTWNVQTTGGPDDWDTAANWNVGAGSIPVGGDVANVNRNCTGNLTVDVSANSFLQTFNIAATTGRAIAAAAGTSLFHVGGAVSFGSLAVNESATAGVLGGGVPFEWTGVSDTDWHTPSNWSNNETPADTDTAAFLEGHIVNNPELFDSASVSKILANTSVTITSSGGTLTVGGGGIEVNTPDGWNPSLDLSGTAIRLGADQTWKITCPDSGGYGNKCYLGLPTIDSNGKTVNLDIGAQTWAALDLYANGTFTVGTVTADGTTRLSVSSGTMAITGDNSTKWAAGGVLEMGSGTVSVSSPNNLGNASVSFLPGSYSVLEYTGSGGTMINTLKCEGYDAPNGYYADGAATLSALGTGALIYSGTITMAPYNEEGTHANTLNLAGTSILNNELQSAVGDGTGGAPTTLVKQGVGTWVLSGNNTYTGGTTVEGGTLICKGANSLPSTATLAVKGGATFSLADGTARDTTTPALTLANRAGLAFDWTSAGTGDKLTSAADIKPTDGSVIGIAVNRSGTPSGSVTLLQGGTDSTLSSSYFFLANNTDFTATLTTEATKVSIGSYAPTTALTDAYWLGGQVKKGTTPIYAMNLSNGATSDWASDATGTSANGVVPRGNDVNVIFGAQNAAYLPSGTEGFVYLFGNMDLNSITINESTRSVGIGSGTITLHSTASEPASTSGANQAVTPGSAITVTPSSRQGRYKLTGSSTIVLGADQTWNVATPQSGGMSELRVARLEGAHSLTLGSSAAYAGTVWMQNAMHTGTTDIKYGTLSVADGGMVPGGTVTVHGGATLRDAGEHGGIRISRPVALAGGTMGATLIGVNETVWKFRTYLQSSLSASGLNNKVVTRYEANQWWNTCVEVTGLTTVQSGGSLEIVGGTGTATLNAAGGASVDGTLVVNGVLDGSRAVVNNGGTLKGTGTVNVGQVTVKSGAWVSPGRSVGTLNTGAVTLNDGSNLRVEMNGSANDLLSITSNLAASATVKVYPRIMAGAEIPTQPMTIVSWSGAGPANASAFALDLTESCDPAQTTVNWVGAASDNLWVTGNNWDLSGLSGGSLQVSGNNLQITGLTKVGYAPLTTSDVVIGPTGSSPEVSAPDSSTTVGSLTVGKTSGTDTARFSVTNGGDMTVTGATVVNATGTLEIGSGRTLTAGGLTMTGGTLKLTAGGAGCGKVVSAGAVALGAGVATLALNLSGAPTEEAYALVEGASLTGGFGNWANGAPVAWGAKTYVVTYTATAVSLVSSEYDRWKQRYFSAAELDDPLVSGDDADPDGDRMPNFPEFLARTNPRDRDSCLVLLGVEAMGDGVVVSWSSETNRFYRIEMATNLVVGFDHTVKTNIAATPSVNVYTDSPPAEAGSRFYRVRLE
jgi:fibronectin-binding autotransporter adhesin